MGKWSQQIRKAVEKRKSQRGQITRVAVAAFAGRLVDRSPVGDPLLWSPPVAPKGYKPGHFVQNWQITPTNNAKEIDGFDPGKEKSIALMRAYIAKTPVGGVYWFSNMVPYAGALERGHSKKQAPSPPGIVKLAVMEFPGMLRAAAR